MIVPAHVGVLVEVRIFSSGCFSFSIMPAVWVSPGWGVEPVGELRGLCTCPASAPSRSSDQKRCCGRCSWSRRPDRSRRGTRFWENVVGEDVGLRTGQVTSADRVEVFEPFYAAERILRLDPASAPLVLKCAEASLSLRVLSVGADGKPRRRRRRRTGSRSRR